MVIDTVKPRVRLPPLSAQRKRPHLTAVSREALTYRPFVIMFAFALALRVAALFMYSPSVLQWVDALRYLRVGPSDFFGDPWSPAGYPAFLDVIHAVSPALVVTTAAQQVLGLVGGTFVYLTVRRLPVTPWLALVPAAIPLLSGDYLFLEHVLMSEVLFMTFLYAAMYAAVTSQVAQHPRRWLALSGVLFALSALVRPITLVLPVVVALWAVLTFPGPARRRMITAASCVAPAGLIVAAYMVVALTIGPYAGISNMSGWDLYARAAPFADCSRFTPPAGTRGLCERMAPNQRPGPFYYDWETTSPGRTLFPHTPTGAIMVGKWARAAILAEPGPYLRAVVKDLVRYVDPSVGVVRPFSGIPYDLYQFSYRSPAEEQLIGHAVQRRGYSGVLPVNASGAPALEAYQAVFHIDGLITLALAVLTLIGAVRCRGPLRRVIILVGGCAALLFLLPVLTLSYDVRYGWPPEPLLAVAAVLSVAGLKRRARGMDAGPAQSSSPADSRQ